MAYDGAILEDVVRKKHKNLTDLADKMGYDRATLYRHFKDKDLDPGIILKYAKALKYDFAYEYPDLTRYTNTLEEPLESYKPMTIAEALKEVDYWKTKYINLLETHSELLRQRLLSTGLAD